MSRHSSNKKRMKKKKAHFNYGKWQMQQKRKKKKDKQSVLVNGVQTTPQMVANRLNTVARLQSQQQQKGKLIRHKDKLPIKLMMMHKGKKQKRR